MSDLLTMLLLASVPHALTLSAELVDVLLPQQRLPLRLLVNLLHVLARCTVGPCKVARPVLLCERLGKWCEAAAIGRYWESGKTFQMWCTLVIYWHIGCGRVCSRCNCIQMHSTWDIYSLVLSSCTSVRQSSADEMCHLWIVHQHRPSPGRIQAQSFACMQLQSVAHCMSSTRHLAQDDFTEHNLLSMLLGMCDPRD